MTKKKTTKKTAKKETIKKLYRKEKEAILGGVCAGIGEYTQLDPVLIRLLWVLFTAISLGAGILAYIIALLIIPKK